MKNSMTALTPHIPEKVQQVARYCGYYSKQIREHRRLQQQCAAGITQVVLSAPVTEPDEFRRHPGLP